MKLINQTRVITRRKLVFRDGYERVAYMVMELVHGRTVQDLASQFKLTDFRIQELVDGILRQTGASLIEPPEVIALKLRAKLPARPPQKLAESDTPEGFYYRERFKDLGGLNGS